MCQEGSRIVDIVRLKTRKKERDKKDLLPKKTRIGIFRKVDCRREKKQCFSI